MLLTAGTIGIDGIHTPHGSRENCIGGSAVHFAYAASAFTPVRLVGIAGNDFPETEIQELKDHNIDPAGVEVTDGKTFRWEGKYHEDMDSRETLTTELNVLATWKPKIPDAWKDSSIVFLANGTPQIQLQILEQMPAAELVVCDTMDLWITTARSDLDALLEKVHGIIINESEAELYTGSSSVVTAGKSLLTERGLFVIIKKGAHGALLFTHDGITALPAYPIENVFDPTGAGDSFAGGFLGYLATVENRTHNELKKALAYATCIGSFNVEDFGKERLARLTTEELAERFAFYRQMLHIE